MFHLCLIQISRGIVGFSYLVEEHACGEIEIIEFDSLAVSWRFESFTPISGCKEDPVPALILTTSLPQTGGQSRPLDDSRDLARSLKISTLSYKRSHFLADIKISLLLFFELGKSLVVPS